ncbi:alpha/beta hydrolase [Brevibacillus brevis]|uniref:Alpha/beta hydrolase n=1 Tax=Brevibacillus brevis TaxID=1393 RepID=A0ABY9T089_BREBE|nr:alpha/beta hydrolase [Brevibacillus brevis]WNC13471.1 alpha/beta hydrolase [Brevibacillus brevis]
MSPIDNYIFRLSDKVTRKSVSYKTRFGITIAADLYLPKDFDESKKHAAVIVGAPYGGVKEQGSGIYAQNMAERGFVALAFDPSYNGYSSGEPRHLSSPDLFVEDFSAAVDYVGTRPFVDRNQMGVIGLCGSGSFAISAAQVDRRIKAIATVSMYDISRSTRNGFKDSFTEEDRNRILDAVAEQRYAEFEGNPPALTDRGAPIGFDDQTDPIGREFGEFYSTPRGYHPNSITQFTVTSTMSFMNFPLLAYMKSISPRPILFIVGEHAHSRYFSEDAYESAAEPKELYIVPHAGHVDLYDKTDVIPFDKLEAFFTENLKK